MVAYYLLAKSEERKVLEQFGNQYRRYRNRVPMFIPRWGQWSQWCKLAAPRRHPSGEKSSDEEESGAG